MKYYNNLKKIRLQEREDIQAQIFSLFNAGFLMWQWKVNLISR